MYKMKITIHVKTKASVNKVVEQDGMITIFTTASPHKGEANKKVIELLSKHLKVSKSNIKIVKGIKSKIKTIEIL